ncbi:MULTISPECIES: AraC family transcriptional regulator [unclassified Lysobacter]|uniref:AraC family transcriptional regulator n=1 Tax=unclassified Lysobacter TaxID=2635362 RepID=UPI000ABCA09E|nr:MULTISPECIES: AraC family transcriptional regulator [unclassified Lysobacter]
MQPNEDARMILETLPKDIAQAIARQAVTAGDHLTGIPALSLHRRHGPTDPVPCIYPLGLVLIAQGAKQVLIGDRILNYAPGQSMVVSLDQPVISHVTRATVHEPFLGLLLRLDLRQIANVASEMETPSTSGPDPRGISIEPLEPALLEALLRLVRALDEPEITANLAPLIEREIAIRLLRGPHGRHLRQLLLEESPDQQIGRVVAWMKQNFGTTFRVEDLANRANMSGTAFRKHFREQTGMSPLQYLKQLRLQEARQLMLNQGVDAGRAAGIVGYQSASQFSREYGRLFGAPPQRDLRRMRGRKQGAGSTLSV